MSNNYVVGINFNDFVCFLDKIEKLISISPEEASKKIREYKTYIVTEKNLMEKQKKQFTSAGYS